MGPAMRGVESAPEATCFLFHFFIHGTIESNYITNLLLIIIITNYSNFYINLLLSHGIQNIYNSWIDSK